MTNKIEIITIPALSDNYIWLIHNSENNLTAAIDPAEAEPVEKILNEKGWELNQIINTHHHFDHTNGNYKLKEKWHSQLIAPRMEKSKIPSIDLEVEDNDEIQIVGLKSKVYHTPGHTLGHVIYYIDCNKILFAGDTMFSLGCGRVFEGTMQDMYKSLEKIKAFDPQTKIYCGHEYTESNLAFSIHIDPENKNLKNLSQQIMELRKLNKPTLPTNLSIELLCNPFLRTSNDAIASKLDCDSQNPLEVFTKLRKLKDNF